MINEEKKKAVVVLVIMFGWITLFWYSFNPVSSSSPSISMPNELKIRDGQTVVYGSLRIEYLYKYVMPNNTTKNVLMVTGYGVNYPYEVSVGGYVNIFQRYRVSIVNNQFVILNKVS